jgi:hypothetical protein
LNQYIPKLKKKSKSSNILTTVSTKLFGPSPDKGLLKVAKQMKKAEKVAKKGGPPVDKDYFNKCLNDVLSNKSETCGFKPASHSATPLNHQYNKKPQETHIQNKLREKTTKHIMSIEVKECCDGNHDNDQTLRKEIFEPNNSFSAENDNSKTADSKVITTN